MEVNNKWKLISKSGEADVIINTVHAMVVRGGCIVKSTTTVRGSGITRLRSKDELEKLYGKDHPTFEQIVEYNYSSSESLVYVPGVSLTPDEKSEEEIYILY